LHIHRPPTEDETLRGFFLPGNRVRVPCGHAAKQYPVLAPLEKVRRNRRPLPSWSTHPSIFSASP